MALPLFTTKDPAAPPTRRWWLSLFPRLSAATKGSLLLLSLSAALFVNSQWANRERPAAPDSPFALPAVQYALQQLNLPVRDPIGDQFQVNTYTTNGQFSPAVALDSNGDFVVIWESNGSGDSDTSGLSIQGQRYNSLGTAQGNQFEVNTYTTGIQKFPAVALDSDGDFVVVWQSNGSPNDNDGYSIQARLYNSAGTQQGSQFQVNSYATSNQIRPAVAMDSDGDFVVVWHSNGSYGSDSSSYSVHGQTFNAAGTPLGGEFQVNTFTTSTQSFPSVAIDSSGDFVVAWSSWGSDGSDNSYYSIQAQRYNSNGTAQGNQFQVNSYTSNSQSVPAVSMDSSGDFVIVWSSLGSNGSDSDELSIQGQRYNAGGAAQGNQFQVNTYTTNVQSFPAVSLDSDGDFVVVWRSDISPGNDNSGYSIQGRAYNAAGSPQGSQFQVNTYTTNNQGRPAVALDSDGDYVVVWSSLGSDGSDTDYESIQGQRFTFEGPTPTVTPSVTPGNTPTPTRTPSPTPTSPAGSSTRTVHLPAIISEEFPYFDEPCEVEPNDTIGEANGYLRSGQNYCGYPNDNKDFFKVYLFTGGTITADLTNHTGDGVQLQLFYQSTGNLVDFDTGLGPLHVEYSGPAGLYYLYIYTNSGFNDTTPYNLIVNYP
jgi:hypothetical protein